MARLAARARVRPERGGPRVRRGRGRDPKPLAHLPASQTPEELGPGAAEHPARARPRARRWEIDWDALERAVTPRTRVFLLCHPTTRSPRVGRGELARAADFCTRHGLVLVSDEIHCDLLLEPGAVHEPAALPPPRRPRGPSPHGPSKTYNTPGSGVVRIIPDAALRARFSKAGAGIVAEVNAFGYAACEAAYGMPSRGARRSWPTSRQPRLPRGHRVRELTGVVIEAPIEATYLAWLNVSALGLPNR